MGKIFNFPTKNKDGITEEIPIEKATHWVCEEVPEGYENLLSADKAYKLLYDEIRDEYYIFDDQGHNANYFLTTPGSFEC